MPAPKKKKKPIDLDRLKAELMENTETIGIARELGIPLEEYVGRVLHFVANPDAEPQMLVVEDKDLLAAGFEVPDAKEMLQFAKDQVKVLEEAGEVSAYKKSEKKKVDLGTRRTTTGDEEVSKAGGNRELKEELEKELRKGRGRKG